MLGQSIGRKTATLCSAGTLILLLLAYTGLSSYQHSLNPLDRTIPTWGQLYEGMAFLLEQPQDEGGDDLLAAALAGTGMNSEATAKKGFLEGRILWEATCVTLGRLFGGLTLGVLGGILVGIWMGCFLKIDASLSPLMYFFSRIIPTAAMPIFFKLAGIDLGMYVVMIAFGSMPVVSLTVSSYVKSFPEELRFKAYTLGASHTELITTAIVPYLLPKLIDLVILMIGPALVYLIAAEQVVAGEGFGYRIRVLTKATRFESVYPLIVILTLYAGLFTYGLNRLKKRLCPWAVAA